MSFHIVSVCSESSFGAIPHCEYLIHKSHALIHSLCTLELTVERHFCSIFKHKYPGPSTGVTAHPTAWSLPACLCWLEIDLREFEARMSNFVFAGQVCLRTGAWLHQAKSQHV